MNQLVIAASENYRQPHESAEDYANRIYQLSLTKASNAAEFGKRIHSAVEVYPQLTIDQEIMPWFLEFEKWWISREIEFIKREKILLDHDLGIAGTTDLIARSKGKKKIFDYKTQDVKVDDKGNKKPAFYDSWVRQLSFYSVAEAKESGSFPYIDACVSVIIDSNPGGLIYEREWTKEEVLSAYQDFCLAAYSWFKGNLKRKPFWPARNGPWSVEIGVKMPAAEYFYESKTN